MDASPTAEQAAAEQQMLLNGPAASPPPGMTSNFIDSRTLDANVWAAATILTLLTTVTGFARLYTKARLIRSVAYEDWVLILAWGGQVAYIAAAIMFVRSGGGTHMWDLQLKDFFDVLYWTNNVGIIYCITICLVKMSILIQYLRIFVPNPKADMRLFIAIHVVLWTNLVFYIIMLGFQIAQCSPREKIWNLLITTGHCINAEANDLATGIFNILSDVSILILPMVAISKLQLPLRKKLLLVVIFATGIFACIISILRTYYNWKFFHANDQSYNLVTFGLWTEAEIAIGFVLSCVPVLPRFFQDVGPKVYGPISRAFKSTIWSSGTSNPSNSATKPRASLSYHVSSASEDRGIRNSGRLNKPFDQSDGQYITLQDFDDIAARDLQTDQSRTLPVGCIDVRGKRSEHSASMV